MRRIAEPGRNAALQIAISVIATISAGLLTKEQLKSAAPSPTDVDVAVAVGIDPQPVAKLLRANFTADGFRLQPSYPVEFGAVFGPATGKPHMEFAGVAWSEPAARVSTAPEPAPSMVENSGKTQARGGAGAQQPCLKDCERRVAVAEAVLPPSRPASLLLEAGIAAPVTSELHQPDMRETGLLGIRLPGFVSSGKAVVARMASLGDQVSGLFAGLR